MRNIYKNYGNKQGMKKIHLYHPTYVTDNSLFYQQMSNTFQMVLMYFFFFIPCLFL